jgi:hypothetical protein
MTTRLKTITPASWLVIGDTDDVRIGLLTQVRNEYILMIKDQKRKFLDRKAVNQYFSEDIFQNIIESDDVLSKKTGCFINGYPTDFNDPHEVVTKGGKLPLYSKKLTSDVYYAAGYYCVNFPKNWMPGFCPKLSTLGNYEYLGPFKTELEMRAALTKARKEKKLKTDN